jgi:hypothetical protein
MLRCATDADASSSAPMLSLRSLRGRVRNTHERKHIPLARRVWHAKNVSVGEGGDILSQYWSVFLARPDVARLSLAGLVGRQQMLERRGAG